MNIVSCLNIRYITVSYLRMPRFREKFNEVLDKINISHSLYFAKNSRCHVIFGEVTNAVQNLLLQVNGIYLHFWLHLL
jgi:hypothetical protein